jgi:hypothetical protein
MPTDTHDQLDAKRSQIQQLSADLDAKPVLARSDIDDLKALIDEFDRLDFEVTGPGEGFSPVDTACAPRHTPGRPQSRTQADRLRQPSPSPTRFVTLRGVFDAAPGELN